MAQKKSKKKNKNQSARKNAAFQATLQLVAADALLTQKEMDEIQKQYLESNEESKKQWEEMDKSEVAKNEKRKMLDVRAFDISKVIVVEGLNGAALFHPERLKRHEDIIEHALREFDDEFFTSDDGVSITKLRRDKKERTWGEEQDVMMLCYLSIALKRACWTYDRKEWAVLPMGLPYIRFFGNNGEQQQTRGTHVEKSTN